MPNVPTFSSSASVNVSTAKLAIIGEEIKNHANQEDDTIRALKSKVSKLC